MRSRDPLGLALVLMTVYALVVGVALVVALRSSTGAVADRIAGAGAAVTVRPSPGAVSVEVVPGMSAAEIERALAEAGAIASERQFSILLEYTGAGPDLRAGRYEFEPGTPAAEVIRRLRAGLTNERLFTVPEGLRLEQIAELLADQEIGGREQWAAALAGPRPESIVAGRPEGASLLGYLLPASYSLGRDTTADELAAAMIEALAEALDDELLAELEAGEFSLHEVLTLASIVEKEAILPAEQAVIASVLLNRLELGIALQVDATVQFAVASRDGGAEGWWPALSLEDKEYDSPYNTYVYPGVPPGPIANPGAGAIVAVVRPADTEFFYFVARCDGSQRHDFAVTLEEHNANVARCHPPSEAPSETPSEAP